MSQLDDDVLTEFADVTTRIKTEFDGLQPSYPIRQKRFKRKPFVLVAAAGAIAASIVIGPSLSGSSNVNQLAWAATPTILSESQLEMIKSLCAEGGFPADYEIAITDERMERGFMILKADRGPYYKPELNRYATMICKYEKIGVLFTTPSIFLAETPGLGNATSWGVEDLGIQKVWIYVSSVESNITRVEVTTAQGLVLDASVANGYTSAWWPYVDETNSTGDAAMTGRTGAFARHYDSEGNLLKTFSLLTGVTTTP